MEVQRALRQVNLNHLRVFEVVYRLGSMSLAARELHLTQPGISQHIKALEESLGIKLFDRVGHKLIPTPNGNLLFAECESTLIRMESLIQSLKKSQGQIMGKVSFGAPINFANNYIIPILALFSRKYPLVEFKITYDFASVLNEKLLEGHLDFAIVDNLEMDPKFVKEILFSEVLELCVSKSHFKNILDTSKTESQILDEIPYLDYQSDGTLLRSWFSHHFRARKLPTNLKVTVMDVEGISRLITHGVGAGILPAYTADNIEKKGNELYRFKGSGKALINKICLVQPSWREPTVSAKLFMDTIRRSFQKKIGD